jgi:flavodoxin
MKRKDKAMRNKTKNTPKIDPSRRDLLKAAVAGLLAGAAAYGLPFPPLTQAAETSAEGKNMLIVYYSRTGNTHEIADQIHEMTGGDILELQAVDPYPEDYEEAKKRAMEELKSGIKPALKTNVEKIGVYDLIFVGTPIWWGTMAGPVKTFLSQYDFSGKTIAPFVTHLGSGLGRSVTDITALCSHSTIPEGLAVWGNSAKTAQNEVSAWVRKLGLKG